MDTTPAGWLKRGIVAMLCGGLVGLPACSGGGTEPIGGEWLVWSSVRERPAQRLLRYAPREMPTGLQVRDRAVEHREIPAGHRAVVARVQEEGLREPLLVYITESAAGDADGGGFATNTVEIDGVEGRLRSTNLGTNVQWAVNGYNAIVTGDAGLDGAVLGTARGVRLPDGMPDSSLSFASSPRGFDVVAISAFPKVRVREATLRLRSQRPPVNEATIRIQFAPGFDPLFAPVPVHADAGFARRTRVRGTDALLQTSREPGFEASGGPMQRLSLTWLEHPRLLITVSVLGRGIGIDLLRQIARSLERISPDRWDQRYRAR